MKLRLVIASHKGGVGKSTISLNLAVALAKAGYKTLLIDTDPQGALNLALGKSNREYPGLSELLWGKKSIEEVLVSSRLNNLSLLTKGQLAMEDVPEFQMRLYDTQSLERITTELEKNHDILLFDTPAGMGMITRAVFRVGSHVLVPFKVDTINLRSLNQILEVLQKVNETENPELTYLGIVLNMFERDKDISFRIAGEVWQNYPGVLETTIPNAEIFAKAFELGAPIALLGTREHPEAKRFNDLANEILDMVYPEEEEAYDQAQQLI